MRLKNKTKNTNKMHTWGRITNQYLKFTWHSSKYPNYALSMKTPANSSPVVQAGLDFRFASISSRSAVWLTALFIFGARGLFSSPNCWKDAIEFIITIDGKVEHNEGRRQEKSGCPCDIYGKVTTRLHRKTLKPARGEDRKVKSKGCTQSVCEPC